MSLQATIRTAAALAIAFGCSAGAQAAFIGGSQITPSTSLPTVLPWTLDQIVDGITSDASPFNGFVSSEATGVISLTLDAEYALQAFVLWNDINVFREGISEFRLDFFDGGATQLGSTSTLTAPIGQLAPSTFTFAPITGVKRVDLVVLSSNVGVFNRIEIREVGFESVAPLQVPEPTPLMLLGAAAIAALPRRRRAFV
jgi:hypothetical protein